MKNSLLKVICLILAIISIYMLPVKTESRYETECVNDYPLMNFVIVIDAGHGGEDGGAIGIKTLTREKDINLEIAKKTRNLFESAGATCVMTRTDEKALCNGKYSKMADMKARAEIIERSNPYIVISIHCNSFPQSKNVKGAQMFYYPGSETGQKLAESIQGSLKNIVDNSNNRQVKSEDFYMLRHGNSTNVMIECGFLSSPEEEEKLISSEYQDRIAYSVFDGTTKYIKSITCE